MFAAVLRVLWKRSKSGIFESQEFPEFSFILNNIIYLDQYKEHFRLYTNYVGFF